MNTNTSSGTKNFAPHPGQLVSAVQAFSIDGHFPSVTLQPTASARLTTSPIVVKGRGSKGKTASVSSKVAPSNSKTMPKKVAKTMKHQPTGKGKKGQQRKPWSSAEDQKLLTVLKENGVTEAFPKIKWKRIAERIGTARNGKQCRDRWQNHLRPGIKKGDWTTEEEKLIKEMHDTFGPKWTAMAKLFKNRSDNDIKNKWYSMMRKEHRVKETLQESFKLKKKIEEHHRKNQLRAATEVVAIPQPDNTGSMQSQPIQVPFVNPPNPMAYTLAPASATFTSVPRPTNNIFQV